MHWVVAGFFAVHYLRPYPRTAVDTFICGVSIALCLFYLWVGYAVFRRRQYIWNIAVGCAAFWIMAFPTGTLLALLLIMNLNISRYSFTK